MMRITQCQGEHLIALTASEASRLVDACALMVLAAESAPRSSLPPEMATLLCELFNGLKSAAGTPTAPEPQF
jgi:hypothetical protein